jgi:hypothetical protein
VNTPKPAKTRLDLISLASSAPVVLGFLGLIGYAVVRVGHDAFYAKFGVTERVLGSPAAGRDASTLAPSHLGREAFLPGSALGCAPSLHRWASPP